MNNTHIPTTMTVEQGAGNIFYITQGYSGSYLGVREDRETCCWWWWWKRREKRLIIHDGILRYIYMNDRDVNTCNGDIINDLIGGLEHSGVIQSSLDQSTGRSHHGSAIRAIHVWLVIVLPILRHIWCCLWWDMWRSVEPGLWPVSTLPHVKCSIYMVT